MQQNGLESRSWAYRWFLRFGELANLLCLLVHGVVEANLGCNSMAASGSGKSQHILIHWPSALPNLFVRKASNTTAPLTLKFTDNSSTTSTWIVSSMVMYRWTMIWQGKSFEKVNKLVYVQIVQIAPTSLGSNFRNGHLAGKELICHQSYRYHKACCRPFHPSCDMSKGPRMEIDLSSLNQIGSVHLASFMNRFHPESVPFSFW